MRPVRTLLAAAVALLLGVTLALPAAADVEAKSFGPITSTNSILVPGQQEAVTVPAVGGSGVTGKVLLTQNAGVFTATGTAVGIRPGQVAVSVAYRDHSCRLNGTESLLDFVVGVWLPSGKGVRVLAPLAKSTSTVSIQNTNGLSIRVLDVGVDAQLLYAALQTGVIPVNLVPTLAPALACAVR